MLERRDQVKRQPQRDAMSRKGVIFPRRERGAFAVMTAVLIFVIVGFCGFALDLSRLYNRKVELQRIANAVALAAAAELNGTKQGIENAVSAASRAHTDYDLKYAYNKSSISFPDDALRFSSAPSGSAWLSADAAKGQHQTMFYVEVDTSRLAEGVGHVDLLLMPVLASARATAQIASRAVAGRSTAKVMPLALCALSNERASARGEELVEHGFRRGISYNLMELNPNDDTEGAHFVVNPVAQPGTTGTADGTYLAVIQPFVCTGTMAMPQATAGRLTVVKSFPLASVFRQLNSRFGDTSTQCTLNGAPADNNNKEYTDAQLTWMTVKPNRRSAHRRSGEGKLFTLAELAPDKVPLDTTPDLYGPLWIYAQPVKYSDYKEGEPEPEPQGYPTFTPDKWSTLYTPGSPTLKNSYLTPSPYKYGQTLGAKTVANRRVLNIPLLRCPVPAGSPASAEVLAIAKFFMTVRASESNLFAEFAGLANPASLGGPVELYP